MKSLIFAMVWLIMGVSHLALGVWKGFELWSVLFLMASTLLSLDHFIHHFKNKPIDKP